MNKKITQKTPPMNFHGVIDRAARTALIISLVLFAFTLSVYSQVAYFPFAVIDDGIYVTDNPYVTSGISLSAVKWAFTTFHADNWHPVTWLSLMLDSQLFGVNPMGFHLVNVVIHALNSALLFLLLRSMTGTVWRSAFAAACFALHPLHVESVAWIAERKDVISTLFLMLTLLFYSCYVKKLKRSMYILSLAAFALGLMAKPMLVTIPVILIILDFWPFARLKIRLIDKSTHYPEQESDESHGLKFSSLLLEKIPFALLATASSAVTLFAQKPSISSLANVPLFTRIANSLWTQIMYVEKMFFPFDLAIIYPFTLVPLWKAGCAAAALCVIMFLVTKYMHEYPYLIVGWLWYLITLLPVVGIIQVGRQSMADRYTYIPLIGLFLVASWGGADLIVKAPKLKNVLRAAAIGVLLYFAAITWVQTGYWSDNMKLVNHTLEVTDADKNYFAHYLLGLVHEQQKKPEQAIAEYMKSIAIEPREPMVHFDLGFLLDAHGNPSEAIRHLKEAIILDPGFAQAHFTLGIVLGNTGKINESINELGEALRIDPDNSKYLNNLGVALAQQGMIDDAIELFSRAVRLNPNDKKAGNNLLIALQQKKLMNGK